MKKTDGMKIDKATEAINEKEASAKDQERERKRVYLAAYYKAHLQEKNRVYRLKNLDKLRARDKAYQQGVGKERKRLYRLAHHAEIKVRGAAYYKAHIQERREYDRLHKAERQEKNRVYRLKNRESIRARNNARYQALSKEERKQKNRAYYLAHQPTLIARSRAFQKNHPQTVKNYRLKAEYGLTQDDIDRLLTEQGGACAICGGKNWYGRWNLPHIDHDHDTGRARAILCANCNTALGLINDDPLIAQAIIDYLKKFKVDALTRDKRKKR